MRKFLQPLICTLLLTLCLTQNLIAQHSVAREWNEAVLHAIRNDYARPTVHARNLFHTSAAMYDAWAIFQEESETYFLGKYVKGFQIPYTQPDSTPADIQAAREEAMSYAVYRLINHRFVNSPGVDTIRHYADSLFQHLGYDSAMVSTDYSTGSAAALGNYIAEQIIAYGMQDNANEENDYENKYYYPVNRAIAPEIPGVGGFLAFPNRWQPITFDLFIDQAGNPRPGFAPPFLSPEWGLVDAFSLQEDDLDIYEREDAPFWVYHDPGDPPYLDRIDGLGTSSEYQWGFALVSIWSSHLDPSDGVMWDISPASIGNIPSDAYPTDIYGYRDFFKLEEGGDPSVGHDLNPHTGEPYPPNMVPRADYARVLAEFWADGPDSETPPGHWFSILNYVNDHPLFEKRYKGEGEVLDALEWDVKAYFTMGGAMHDAAVTAWGIKGWYDYIRPISAIRYMAGRGQSSDSTLENYHPAGIPLLPGFIEVVGTDDPLVGDNQEHRNKIKLKAWRGPDFIPDPETTEAGVDWILAENWWPYQRPTFVTPPFAGFVSGHSTYSAAAAEIMTMLTGDAFFPGGVGEFVAKKNEFLVFEEGPSVDVTLQWATYKDASDQTSLSRIWGGIHPPADDIPGRLIGVEVGRDAFDLAEAYFGGIQTGILTEKISQFVVYPNPSKGLFQIALQAPAKQITVMDQMGRLVLRQDIKAQSQELSIDMSNWSKGLYILHVEGADWVEAKKLILE